MTSLKTTNNFFLFHIFFFKKRSSFSQMICLYIVFLLNPFSVSQPNYPGCEAKCFHLPDHCHLPVPFLCILYLYITHKHTHTTKKQMHKYIVCEWYMRKRKRSSNIFFIIIITLQASGCCTQWQEVVPGVWIPWSRPEEIYGFLSSCWPLI